MALKSIKPLGLHDFLVFIAFTSLVLVQLVDFPNDPGVGWHLGVGQYIGENWSVPNTDPFLASEFPRPWIADQWLGSFFLFACKAIGDWTFLYLVMIFIYVAVFLWVLKDSLYRVSGSHVAAAIAAVMAFKIGQIHFLLRPVMLSFLFFALTTGCAFQSYSRGSISKPVFGVLLAVFLIWANVHPSFVLGFAILGALLFSFVYESRYRQETLLQVGAIFMVTLLNPYGYHLHASILSLWMSGFAMRFYSEWQPPDFGGFEGTLFMFPLAIVLITALASKEFRERWSCFSLIVIAAFTYKAGTSVRFFPFYGIVIAIPITWALIDLGKLDIFDSSRVFKRLKKAFQWIEEREGRSYRGAFAGVASVGVLLGVAVSTGQILGFNAPLGPSSEKYPYRAVDALRELSRDVDKIVIANELAWGGFIPWYGGAKMKPLIDDRTGLLGEDAYNDYLGSFTKGGDWRGYLARHKTDYLFIKGSSHIAKEIQEDIPEAIMFRDGLAIIVRTKFLR